MPLQYINNVSSINIFQKTQKSNNSYQSSVFMVKFVWFNYIMS